MPKKQNRAAAAIAGETEGTFYSLASDLTYRFQQYVLRREALKRKGSTLKYRLFAARAMEVASIMASLLAKDGDRDEAEFWERRRKLNEAIAFNHKNGIAATIGAGDPDNGSITDDGHHEDPDD